MMSQPSVDSVLDGTVHNVLVRIVNDFFVILSKALPLKSQRGKLQVFYCNCIA